jgi:predicted phosphodiesterase
MINQRREFLRQSLTAASAATLTANVAATTSASYAADANTGTASLPLLRGAPVLSGPASESLTILQSVGRPATGYLEIQEADGPWRRVDDESAGLLPYVAHVLKFRLPPVRPGSTVRYRVTVTAIDFKNAYEIERGETARTEEYEFRALDPAAEETRFVVWNDTHENLETIRKLHARTVELRPDFLLWNGDQTNDVYDEAKMAGQYLAPGDLPISARWPLAYARGNHDVRGPAARHLHRYTGTPGDRFYYAFRSGPLAALVMDTGEDKPDDHPVFAGLAGFDALRRRQTEWLAETIRQPWFQAATHRVLFCHIPLWWKDEKTDHGYWWFSRVSRDSWLPLLREAGVKLVVSGHTHEEAWLPMDGERPIGQLVGGGPQPARATIMLGHATRDELTIEVAQLDGRVVRRLSL